MQLKFIGTGSGKTSLKRFHSSILFENDKSILIDTGDGISKALLKQNISWNLIDVIIITHFHADHIAGLPSLLTQMIIENRETPLKIFTHKNLVNLLTNFLNASFLFLDKLNYQVEVIGFEFNHKQKIDNQFQFTAKQNTHITNKHNLKNLNLAFISASFLFNINDKKIIYTSDIGNKTDLSLFENRNIDYFITETTHISIPDLEEHILKHNFKSVILTHISDNEEVKLRNFAVRLENTFNKNVILAEDGMIFPL